ncbi:hypothetical protein [Streptomyces sp. NPDC088785]|uniref:hypothetical protein n=1 Tax=Streptomyces sp. NPDC088785 TaxID=3365897 RepID=UPI0038032927
MGGEEGVSGAGAEGFEEVSTLKGLVGGGELFDAFSDEGWEGHFAELAGFPVLEGFEGGGSVVDLFVDAVDVFGDHVVDVDGECFAVAQAHAGHGVDDEAEGVVCAGCA